MMEFETWNRETLINEIKTAMMQAAIKSHGNFLGMPITIKFISDEDLSQQTDFELRSIFVQYKKHDDAFCRQYEENEERNRFFNKPECIADFEYWSKQAYWSIDEAIALSFGKDPRKVTWDNVKPYLQSSPFAMKFCEIRELARRYVNWQQLFDPVLPGIFLAWAKRMNLCIPAELIDATALVGVQVADWKSNYEQTAKQLEQMSKLYDEAMTLCDDKSKIIEVLKLRISNLENNQPVEALVNDELKETERQSLYKLIAAMAYDIYRYNPTDKKSTVPKEISDAVTEHLGEKIDPDTARKWLKEATSKYPHHIPSKTE